MAEMMQNTSAVVSMTSRVAYQSIIKATTTLLAIFPLLILYVICQRFFTESVERSGIVG